MREGVVHQVGWTSAGTKRNEKPTHPTFLFLPPIYIFFLFLFILLWFFFSFSSLRHFYTNPLTLLSQLYILAFFFSPPKANSTFFSPLSIFLVSRILLSSYSSYAVFIYIFLSLYFFKLINIYIP